MLTEQLLEDLGYEMGDSVATFGAGLKAAAEGDFEKAVLDINLRGSTSFPIAQILLDRGIPFIFASGYASDGIDTRFDAVPRLQKPFNTEALERCLNRALAL